MKTIFSICSATCLFFPLVASSQAQQAAPGGDIKVQASSVVVDVIVTDRKGHSVPGLKASDFSILEDGIPQPIVSFSGAENTATENPNSPAVKASERTAGPGISGGTSPTKAH